jgi:hypothetical protein
MALRKGDNQDMPSRTKKEQEFKSCDCGRSWKTREEFLKDGKVKIVGYQPDLVNHKYNHFVFFHRIKDCGRFFGIRASDFSDLRDGRCPKELCMGQEDCPGYCTDTLDLRVCSVACRNATDRAVAAKISKRRLLRGVGIPDSTSDSETRKSTKRRKGKSVKST